MESTLTLDMCEVDEQQGIKKCYLVRRGVVCATAWKYGDLKSISFFDSKPWSIGRMREALDLIERDM